MNLLALINEAACIGCTKCIQACPVDAIFGASQMLHTVIEKECIGCELCVPACPVDCIEMITAPELGKEERLARASLTKKRVQARKARLAQQQPSLPQSSPEDKKAMLKQAMERARGK